MEVPFWEETYKDDTVFTFGNQPNQSITAIENLLDKSGRVLDVGCGDGKIHYIWLNRDLGILMLSICR